MRPSEELRLAELEIAAKRKYMSVWRRDDEGRWVVVADLGHSDP